MFGIKKLMSAGKQSGSLSDVSGVISSRIQLKSLQRKATESANRLHQARSVIKGENSFFGPADELKKLRQHNQQQLEAAIEENAAAQAEYINFKKNEMKAAVGSVWGQAYDNELKLAVKHLCRAYAIAFEMERESDSMSLHPQDWLGSTVWPVFDLKTGNLPKSIAFTIPPEFNNRLIPEVAADYSIDLMGLDHAE